MPTSGSGPIKFILALDAKMQDMPRLNAVLNSIYKVLQKVDPGLKMTKASLYGVGYAAGTAVKGFNALGNAARSGASAAMRAWHGLAGAMKEHLGGKNGPAAEVGGRIGGFFKDAASTFVGFASFQGLKSLIEGTVHASLEMVKLASNARDTERILSTVAGPRDAKRIGALADEFAKASGIDSDAFTTMATGLLRAGLPLEKLQNFFALASDITGLTQWLPDKAAKTAKATDVGNALINMQRKGGLDKGLLADVGVPQETFFKAIAKSTGMSAAEARARAHLPVSEGGISPDTLFAAAESSLGSVRKGAPGSVGDQMGKSPMAQLERLTGARDNLFKALSDTDGVTKMGEALGHLADLLDPSSPSGKKITAGLSDMLAKMAEVFKTIDVKAFSDTLTSLFTKLPGLIGATVKALEGLSKIVGAFTGASPAAASGPGLPDLGRPMMTIAKRPADWKWGVDKDADALFRMAEGQGQNVDKGMAAGLSGGEAPTAFDTLIEDMKAKPPAELEMHSPSRLFERYGRMVGQGFADGIAGSSDAIDAATDRSLPTPSLDVRRLKAAGAAGDSAITVSAPITVNYSGPGGQEAAEHIAELIKDLLPGQLQSVFTRLSLEAGTA
jgi:hypothetical protein